MPVSGSDQIELKAAPMFDAVASGVVNFVCSAELIQRNQSHVKQYLFHKFNFLFVG